MFVLDTNVVSELRKAGDGKADRRVAEWVAGQAASAATSLSSYTERSRG